MFAGTLHMHKTLFAGTIPTCKAIFAGNEVLVNHLIFIHLVAHKWPHLAITNHN